MAQPFSALLGQNHTQKHETFRAIRKAEFDGATKGVAREIELVADRFQDAA
jgi:hypothetical protein